MAHHSQTNLGPRSKLEKEKNKIEVECLAGRNSVLCFCIVGLRKKIHNRLSRSVFFGLLNDIFFVTFTHCPFALCIVHCKKLNKRKTFNNTWLCGNRQNDGMKVRLIVIDSVLVCKVLLFFRFLMIDVNKNEAMRSLVHKWPGLLALIAILIL